MSVPRRCLRRIPPRTGTRAAAISRKRSRLRHCVSARITCRRCQRYWRYSASTPPSFRWSSDPHLRPAPRSGSVEPLVPASMIDTDAGARLRSRSAPAWRGDGRGEQGDGRGAPTRRGAKFALVSAPSCSWRAPVWCAPAYRLGLSMFAAAFGADGQQVKQGGEAAMPPTMVASAPVWASPRPSACEGGADEGGGKSTLRFSHLLTTSRSSRWCSCVESARTSMRRCGPVQPGEVVVTAGVGGGTKQPHAASVGENHGHVRDAGPAVVRAAAAAAAVIPTRDPRWWRE